MMIGDFWCFNQNYNTVLALAHNKDEELLIFHGEWRLLRDELALKAPQERSDEENQLCLGIIASGMGFVLA
ncbi:hypothetical protein ACIQ7N_19320 [Lysinibacillus sp. NPDC095746]|uniref:hypothetical protein n=1 Tax=Lysinibacillus sp. NPDC095746 TaxID=3364134 RepID=UPI00382F5CD6